MSIGLPLYMALVITLAAAAAWAAEALCRQFGRPTRWVWPGASLAALVLAVRATLTMATQPASATYQRIAFPAVGRAMEPAWTPLGDLREALVLAVASVDHLISAVLRAIPPGAASVVASLWLAASLMAFVLLVLVHVRIRRARRHWAEIDLFGTRVNIAPDVGPAVVGVVRPRIVVPRWLLGRSAHEQQLVLAHEREHLGAGDHLLLAAGSLVVALVPWHPATWWMLARLRLAIELDCDARVLRRGVPARTYGTLLIDLADRCTGFRVGATALADEGSHLERRLLAMKTTRTKRSLLRTGLLGTAAALALLAACEAKVPTGPEIQAMDVASASRAVAGTRMLQKSQLDSSIFYVDGVQVDSRTANSLTPNQIATIDITKKAADGSASTIRITTNGQPRSAEGQAAKGSVRMSMHGDSAAAGTGTLKVEGTAARQFDGLLLIDGVKADQSVLATLDPKRIEGIQVIKGAAAEKLSSDPLAKNGIIKVTTKK